MTSAMAHYASKCNKIKYACLIACQQIVFTVLIMLHSNRSVCVYVNLCVCVCVCIYTYTKVCSYMHMYTHVCICIHICIYEHTTCIHIYTYTNTLHVRKWIQLQRNIWHPNSYVFLFIYTNIYMYIYIHTYIYVYMYMLEHTRSHQIDLTARAV